MQLAKVVFFTENPSAQLVCVTQNFDLAELVDENALIVESTIFSQYQQSNVCERAKRKFVFLRRKGNNCWTISAFRPTNCAKTMFWMFEVCFAPRFSTMNGGANCKFVEYSSKNHNLSTLSTASDGNLFLHVVMAFNFGLSSALAATNSSKAMFSRQICGVSLPLSRGRFGLCKTHQKGWTLKSA